MRQQSKMPGNPFAPAQLEHIRMNRGITTVRIDLSGNRANWDASRDQPNQDQHRCNPNQDPSRGYTPMGPCRNRSRTSECFVSNDL